MCIGDDITQLYNDFNKPLQGSPLIKQYLFATPPPPEKERMPPKIGTISKGHVIFQPLLFRGHVSFFWVCIYFGTSQNDYPHIIMKMTNYRKRDLPGTPNNQFKMDVG